MSLKHVLSSDQFLDKEVLFYFFQKAQEYQSKAFAEIIPQVMQGKILSIFFYEASTRTSLSFDFAMKRLGGRVSRTDFAGTFSSAKKGETLEHTIQVLSSYGPKAIVLRHNEQGAAQRAARASSVPIINAGDGAGEHPTQALLDIWTIQKEHGRLNDLHIAVVGDLKYGRTVHSLLKLLAVYEGNQIYLVSPERLALPKEHKDRLDFQRQFYTEEHDLREVLEKADIVYMTRTQKERNGENESETSDEGYFKLKEADLSLLKQTARIMHPLPVDDEEREIAPEVFNDARCIPFEQAENGLYMRMALLDHVINGK